MSEETTHNGQTGDVRSDADRTAGGTGSRWRLQNWRLRTKLLVVLLIPTILALILGGIRVRADVANLTDAQRLAKQVQLQSSVADLVQQLQRERDLTAQFVAANRTGDQVSLDRERDRVVQDITAFRNLVNTLGPGLSPDVEQRFSTAADQLSRLTNLRKAVQESQYPASATFNAYSDSIQNLLDLGEQAISTISDPSLVRLQLAVNAVARAKEQDSRKRGILLQVFQNKNFPFDQYRALLAADAELDAAKNDFAKSATPDQQRIFDDTVTGLIVDDANKLEESALIRGTNGQTLDGLTTTQWDIDSTLTVNLTNQVQQALLQQLQQQTNELANTSQDSAIRNSALVLGALLLALVTALFVARSLLRPLRVLRRTALDIADHRLPEEVQRILTDPNPAEAAREVVDPVPIHTKEEVGQLARAFDAVHGEAVRMAAQQALLRDNVNAMFVNLSRRSQALVERQLGLIDRLEQDEQDPDQLANLFELDHLATRMRRNSENLLVLSGTDLGRRLTRPVPAGDVVGAAVSEVEQYARIQVAPTPELTVQGRAVNDLVHLIAELLDNATAFSDPNTKVTVRTAKTRRGELAIEIHDRGVGMSAADVEETNQRLADPPEVDVAVSRRMGLYVVARLAKRHDIKVRLRGNEDIEGGMTALVVVPSSLVLAPGADVSTPPSGGERPASQVGGGIANAFGMSRRPATPPVQEQQPLQVQEPAGDPGVPVQFVSSAGSPELGVTGVPRWSPNAPAAPAPQESTATWFPSLEDSAAGQPVDMFASTSFQEMPEEQLTQGINGNGSLNGHAAPPAAVPAPAQPEANAFPSRDLDHELDAPTERLPIYEAVLSQWFQAVEEETPDLEGPFGVPASGADDLPAGPATATMSLPLPEVPDQAAAEAAAPEAAPQAAEQAEPAAPEAQAEPPAAARPAASMPLPKRTPRSTSDQRQAPAPAAAVESEPARQQQPETPAARNGSAPLPTRPARPAAARSNEWTSPGDEGWQAAESLLNQAPDTQTNAGLPKRVPKAHLIPGSAAPKNPAAVPNRAPAAPRSADSVRGRMSSFQQGVRRGRHALIDAYSGDASTSPQSSEDEEQE
ncbi:nitrate- and nitrite sensing domain-containing protein [Kutzneria kofuensis]|uniref:histidine kinase n=1 Tax=Kutzneria kofuensis TaxID=103725 RepID=A0A7W9NGW4_9PSEU|nr:nitrate- and nitrite sensing domain-containing protein [Kutzneria kofuensis]MBB5892130.1 signal transduction histidine kinase [Kutzneria kofuensis]